MRWLLSVATTLFLMGTLFLTGLVTASAQEDRGRSGSRQKPARASIAIAALVTVGALLGLVPSLRVLLWDGPAWLRWAIVGLATTAVLISSGRAIGFAVLGGLIWSAVGAWSGSGRDLVGRTDVILTGLMVGTAVGAVGGTLWMAGRRSGPKGL
jgi:hypothetical protein